VRQLCDRTFDFDCFIKCHISYFFHFENISCLVYKKSGSHRRPCNGSDDAEEDVWSFPWLWSTTGVEGRFNTAKVVSDLLLTRIL
jgi:hypothetical protein